MAEDKELKRGLNLPMAIFIIVGMVIGSSIWVSPAAYLSRTGPAIFLAYILAVIPSVFVAYVCAYIGAALPVAGGTYTINGRLLGGFAGFMTSWMVILAVGAAMATLSGALGLFVSEIFLIPPDMQLIFVVVIGVIALTAFYLLNYIRIEITGAVEMIITIFGDILVMLIFIIAAIPFFNPSYFEPFIPPELGFGAVLFAALTFFFSYTGFTLIIDVAGEVKNPRKNIPRALVIAMIILIALYSIQALMVAGIQPYNEPVGTVTEIILKGGILPPGAVLFMTILIIIAISSTLHPLFMAFSRDLLMAGRDGIFPKKFAKVHNKYKTPIPALTLLYIVGLAFLLIFIPLLGPDFGIATTTVLLSAVTGTSVLILQIPICIGVMFFPKKFPNLHEQTKFKPSMKILRIMCALGAISSFIFVLLLMTDPDAGLIIALIIFPFAGIGALVYLIRRYQLSKAGISIKEMMKTFPKEITFEQGPPGKVERLAEKKK